MQAATRSRRGRADRCVDLREGVTPMSDSFDEKIAKITATRRAKIKLVPWNEIRRTESPPWLVRGLIPLEGLTVIWGPPKQGKSFFAFDLMMHPARGIPYRERAVVQGPVVYCAFEGETGFAKRIAAYQAEH